MEFSFFQRTSFDNAGGKSLLVPQATEAAQEQLPEPWSKFDIKFWKEFVLFSLWRTATCQLPGLKLSLDSNWTLIVHKILFWDFLRLSYGLLGFREGQKPKKWIVNQNISLPKNLDFKENYSADTDNIKGSPLYYHRIESTFWIGYWVWVCAFNTLPCHQLVERNFQ